MTHWKSLGDPNFLGGFEFGPGEEKTLTIKTVRDGDVFDPGTKKKEIKRCCEFKENVKPMILNATNAKTIAKMYNSDFVEDWVGKKITIYFDPTVKVGRDTVGGLRIRPHMPKSQEISLKCSDCSSTIIGFDSFTAEQVARGSFKKYGKPLCRECASKIEEAKKAEVE